MLYQIAKALTEYNETGTAVITSIDNSDPREIAAYVLAVLRGLKCSYSHYYHDVEHSYFIIDRSQ